MRLKNKRIIITGASRGLGRAIASRCVAEGADIALCARNPKDLYETQDILASSGQKVIAIPCDIGNSLQCSNFIAEAAEKLGSIDVLINNASLFGIRAQISDYPIDTWDEVIQTNINGLFFITKYTLPFLLKQQSGAIINVSASVGRAGRALWGAFGVSKFALEGFTQVLAEELKQTGISVNAVNPGAIATELRRQASPKDDQTLLRTPEQITDIFVYLASDNGKGISGQTFDASTFITNPRTLQ